MPRQTVDFGNGDVRRIRHQIVYLRAPGEDSWLSAPDILATQVSWTLAPTIPTATLVRYYGVVRDITGRRIFLTTPAEPATEFEERERLDLTDYLIRIDIYLESDYDDADLDLDNRLTWHGIIGGVVDNPAGLIRDRLPAGSQVYSAFGLEQILRSTMITKSQWIDVFDTSIREMDNALTFNLDGKPNRSPEQVPGGGYVFKHDPEPLSTVFWRPNNIINYLVRNYAPRDGVNQPIFALSTDTDTIAPDDGGGGGGIVPTNTHPVVECEGRSLYDVFNDLMNPSGLLGWNLVVTSELTLPGPISAKLTAHSLHASALAGLPIPANDNTRDIIAEKDPLTTLTVEETALERVDQVIIRGGKRVYVFSTVLEDDTPLLAAKPIEKDWTDEQATDYQDAGNPTGTTDQQLRKANEYRSKNSLRKVFSAFRIGRAWGGTTTGPSGVQHDVITDREGVLRVPYRGEVRILPTLPFETDEDDRDKLESPRRNIVIVAERPNQSLVYISGDQMQATLDVGDLDSDESSRMTLEAVVDDDRNIRVIVGGEPQHAIAGDDFTKKDFDRDHPSFDYKKIWVTLAVESHLWVERKYPEELPMIGGTDMRVKVIQLGDRDEFKVINVVAESIISVNPDGSLVFADAGLLKDGARDDSEFDKIGKILREYYSVNRRKVSIWTHRISDNLNVGDMLLTISQKYEVGEAGPPAPIVSNTVINEIVIDMPVQSASEQGTAPLIRYSTYAPDDIDPMAIADGVLGNIQPANIAPQQARLKV